MFGNSLASKPDVQYRNSGYSLSRVSAEISRFPDDGILTALSILDFLYSKNSLTSTSNAFEST